MKKYLLFILILIIGFNYNFAQVPQSERDALVELYNSTNGNNWNTNTNWLDTSQSVGNWYGVTVGNGHVKSINLGDNNLTGTLPTEIGDFPELEELFLWSNNLTGNIPTQIGSLTNLIHLDLAPNGFSGSIPTEIGNLTNLEILWLNNCGLSGSIPQSFQNLINLKELYLQGAIFGSYPNYPAWANSEYSGDFPDLTALPLEILRIKDNFFTYDNIDDHLLTYINNIPGFQYSPQLTQDIEETITFTPGDDITLTMTDTPTPSGINGRSFAPNTYQWYKDGNEIIGATSLTYMIANVQNTDEGVYIGKITNADAPAFEYSTPPFTLENLLNSKIENQNNLTVYPNPVKNKIYIDIKNFTEPIIITVYDARGRHVASRKISTNEGLDINFLPHGIYLLKIKTNRFSITKKIIKQ